VLTAVEELWNEAGGQKHHGFNLKVKTERIAACCNYGGIILNDHFPNPPGVFKRLAALLVLGRHFPLFDLEPRPQNFDLWSGRVLALTIPPVLRTLEINLSTDRDRPRWVQLDNWEDYPSPHYKLEFLTLLEWLDGAGWPHPSRWTQQDRKRVARITLALALILEGCYYCSEGLPKQPGPNHIRKKGPCLHMNKLDLTAISYDGFIYDYARNQTVK
jgi:hypothetical protein